MKVHIQWRDISTSSGGSTEVLICENTPCQNTAHRWVIWVDFGSGAMIPEPCCEECLGDPFNLLWAVGDIYDSREECEVAMVKRML